MNEHGARAVGYIGIVVVLCVMSHSCSKVAQLRISTQAQLKENCNVSKP
jgi:hypothetical protein